MQQPLHVCDIVINFSGGRGDRMSGMESKIGDGRVDKKGVKGGKRDGRLWERKGTGCERKLVRRDKKMEGRNVKGEGRKK